MSSAYERLQQRKQNNTTKVPSDKKTSSSAFERLQQRKKKKEYNDTIKFDTLESDINTLSANIQKVYDGWQTEETLNNTRSSIEAMQNRITAYQNWQKEYGDGKGADLTELSNNYKSMLEGWDELYDTYGKYDSADAYKKAMKEAGEAAKIHESKKTADLKVVQTEIDDLQKILDTAKSKKPKTNLTTSARKGRGAVLDTQKRADEQKLLDDYLKSVGYSSVEDIEKALGEKKAYKKSAEYIQGKMKLSTDAITSENFDDYVKSGSGLNYEDFGDGNYTRAGRGRSVYVEDKYRIAGKAAYDYFNGDVTDTGAANDANTYSKYRDLMTEDEFKTFAYYREYDKQNGTRLAYDYIDSIEEDLNIRYGNRDYAKMKDKSALAKVLYGVPAGLDQFASGIENAFNFEDEYIPTSSTQVTGQLIREDLSNDGFKLFGTSIGQIGYDLTQTTANMLPSILASSVSNALLPGSGAVVGATLMGTSAAGNSYQQMLNQGYDKSQARTYGTLVGVAEAGLQYAFGGISKLGGKLTGKGIEAIANGVDNALGRFAIKYGLNIASEGFEEAAQEVLNPFFENLALGYSKNDLTDVEWGEVAYSGVLGALSAGFLEGGSTAVSTFSENASAKKTGANIRGNNQISGMLDIASLSQEEADAYNLYTQYANKGVNAENISDLQLGRLYQMASADAQSALSSHKSTTEEKVSAKNTLNDLAAYSQNNSAKNLGKKNIKELYGDKEGTSALIEEGLESAENTESYKLATELKAKMDAGEKITEVELAQLADANTNAYKGEIKTDAEARLTELGETNVAELSEIIVKKSNGELLTNAEKETLQKNMNATKVYNEINNEDLVANTENMSEGEANLILSTYDDSISIDSFMNSYNLVKSYATNRFSNDYVLEHRGKLTPTQVSAIYSHFVTDKDAKTQKMFDDLKVKHKNAPFQFGAFNDSVIDYNNSGAEGKVNWNDLNDDQKNAITIVGTIAQQSGLDVELIIDGYERGINGAFEISGNKILIDVYAGMDKVIGSKWDNLILPTLSHEMTHWMEEKAPELYRKYSDYVMQTLVQSTNKTEDKILDARRRLLEKKHPGQKFSDDYVRREVIARASEDMLGKSEVIRGFLDTLPNAEKKTFVEKVKEILQKLKDWFNSYLAKNSSKAAEAKVIREAVNRIDGQIELWDAMLKSAIETNQALKNEGIKAQKNTTEGDEQFAIREEYAKELDAWVKEGKPDDETFILGTTGDVLQGLGAIESDIYMLSDKINEILNKHPEMTIEEIKKIPQILENPVLILKSQNFGRNTKPNTRLVIFGNIMAQDGRPILSVLDLRPIENNLAIDDMQKVSSAYTKDYNPVDYVRNSLVLYADKKRTTKLLRTIGFQTPIELQQSGYIGIISYIGQNVNIEGKEFSKVFKDQPQQNSDRDTDDYSRIQEMQTELNQIRQTIIEMQNSEEFKTVHDNLSKAIDNGDVENGIKAYKEWQETSGYAELSQKRDTLQLELENLRKSFEENIANENIRKEQEAIAKSGLSEADYFRKQAVKEFGYTPYFYDAGYITPNGKMLNFSGEKGKHYGTRGQDHRAIGIIYADTQRTKALWRFVKDGNIRIMAESPGVDISTLVEPTTEQYSTIKKFIYEYTNKEYFNVDLTDENGNVIGSLEYENHINPTRIINDIKHYYATGEIRGQSETDKFRYSDRDETIDTQINQSMTMNEAKDMIQRAFVLGGIQEWYDGEYKSGDEWLRAQGVDEVALYIENEYALQQKYLDKIQGILEGEFYVQDILNAYLNGTLTGKEKPKTKRLDITKEYRVGDKRFYSPQRIKDVKKLLNVASQRVTKQNRDEVSNARAKILLFAHNKGASELLGLTQTELNKKLRVWSGYPAGARETSKRFNNNVADSNKWTGIENCSWLYRSTITTKELESLVKEIKGAASDYEKLYIARTMLALDTHIDWSWLSFEFDTYEGVNKKQYGEGKCNGFYRNDARMIVVSHNKPNTVAHEMGHALDYQWARDLGYSYEALTEVSRNTQRITDTDTKQFFDNFKIFIDSLTDNGDIRSEYTQNPKEVFARFVARFIEWVDNTGTGRKTYNTEFLSYNDKFTASNYIEFVRLLQEKAMLDSKRIETETNEDVQFSDRDEVNVYDLMGENQRLIKENEQFKADVERLKERLKIERQVTHGNYFNENQINAVAGHLRKIANTTYDKVELMKELRDFYSYIAHAEELSWEDVFSKSYSIAKNMLTERKEEVFIDDYFKEMLKDIRSQRISLNDKQKQTAEYTFGKDYHKFLFGKFNIAKDGLPLDIAWQQWANKYGRFDTETTDADQIIELYNIYEEAKQGAEVVAEYNEEETARWLANEIYNQYWNVSPIRTTADKYDKQIKRLNAEHRNAMRELRDNYNNRLAEQKKAGREKYQKLAQEIRERKDKEIAEVKKIGQERMAKYKENAERKTKIQSITANSLTLNKWLTTNSKDYHIHENMKAPVIALLNAIDFSSKRMLDKNYPTQKDIYLSKALSKVKDMMADATNLKEGLEELYGHDMDEELAALVDSVDNIALTVGNNEYVLNQMSLEELQTLDKLVKTIKHTVTKLNTFHTVHHNRGIYSLANTFMEHGEKLGELKKQDGKIAKHLKFRNCTPYYFFKRLGEAGELLFEAFQDGWDKLAFNSKQIIDFANEVYTDKEVRNWTKETKKFTVKLTNGKTKTFEMSVAQIMALHCVSKQKDAQNHLFDGGMTLSRFDKKGNVVATYKNIPLSVTDLGNILSTLTDRQKEVADKLQEFMNTVCSDWGNEISMARFGVKMFGLPDYFPIKVSPAELPQDNTKEVENVSLFRLLNMSFTKTRKPEAKQSIEIGDIFDIFAQHTTDMAKYNALALPVLDFNKFYSIKGKNEANEVYGVKSTLMNVFGIEANEYARRFVRDINGSQNVSRDVLGKTFFKNAKVAAVAANLRVVLLQPTAFFKASAVLDNKYLLKAGAYMKVNPISMKGKFEKAIANAEKYCGIIQWKALGYYDTDISKGIAEKVKHAETFKDKAIEKSLKGAELADKLTFGTLWVACDFEIRDTRKDLKVGSDEFYQAVAKRLREVIYATQVVDSTMTRTDMMRSSDTFDKMLTTFGSEPAIAYNMLMDMAMQFGQDKKTLGKKEAWKKNGKKIRKVIASYVLVNAVAALVESGFDVYRDDDDEEDKLEQFMGAYLKNFAFDMSIGNKLPYIKESYSVFQGYSSSRMDTQWMEYVYGTLTANNFEKFLKNGLKLGSNITGFAFYNVYRDLMATLFKLGILDKEDIENLFS